jgi:hypothetical protein
LKLTIGVVLLLAIALSACSTKPPTSNTSSSSTPEPSNAASQPSPAAAGPQSGLREGEANGTVVDEGETVTIKYAYAGHGVQFGEDAVVLYLTDTPVPPEVLAKAFEDEDFPSGARGLEYKIGTGFWVGYHPGAFQTSGKNTLKDYSVENGVVKGSDEDSTNFDGKDYKRSVSFVARLSEKKK